MRKRKKRYKRRYKRRYRRSSYNRAMRKAGEEVKYATVYNTGKGIPVDITADTYIPTGALIFNNLFGIIAKGTNYYNRIGNKVFVKNIVLKADMWTCGFTDSTGYRRDINSALVRVFVTSLNSSTLQPAFFSPANGGAKMLAPINRKNYQVHYDKTISLSEGYTNDTLTTSSAYYTGKIKRFSVNLRVNKFISWNDFTDIPGAGSEGLTNHNYYYSLGALSAIPRNGPDEATPVCSNWYARIYFTDV